MLITVTSSLVVQSNLAVYTDVLFLLGLLNVDCSTPLHSYHSGSLDDRWPTLGYYITPFTHAHMCIRITNELLLGNIIGCFNSNLFLTRLRLLSIVYLGIVIPMCPYLNRSIISFDRYLGASSFSRIVSDDNTYYNSGRFPVTMDMKYSLPQVNWYILQCRLDPRFFESRPNPYNYDYFFLWLSIPHASESNAKKK
jgi:hypothetical protein